MEFTKENKILAFDFLVKKYFESGFGMLPKSEIDLMFFSIVNQYSSHANSNDYEFSKLLKISQQKIINLKIKEGLKYTIMDKNRIINEFESSLKNAKLSSDEKHILLLFKDPNIRIEIENIIEQNDGFIEYKMNRKILEIRLDQLLELSFIIASFQDMKSVNSLKKDFLEKIKKNITNDNEKRNKIFNKKDIDFDDVKNVLKNKFIEESVNLIIDFIPYSVFLKPIMKHITNKL
jgi:hypothetical protein